MYSWVKEDHKILLSAGDFDWINVPMVSMVDLRRKTTVVLSRQGQVSDGRETKRMGMYLSRLRLNDGLGVNEDEEWR